jgi:hypothetical protein
METTTTTIRCLPENVRILQKMLEEEMDESGRLIRALEKCWWRAGLFWLPVGVVIGMAWG